LCVVFGTVIEAVPSRRIKPLWLGAVAGVVFLLSSVFHVASNYDAAERTYAAPVTTQMFETKTWVDGAWMGQPGRRIDMSGRPQEVFTLQWAGSLENLQSALEQKGWKALPKWHWRDVLGYLNLTTKLVDVQPRPLVHQGLSAKLTLARMDARDDKKRLVIRIYKTQAALIAKGGPVPVFLVSLTDETLKPRLDLYAIPKTVPAGDADMRALLGDVGGIAGTTVLVKAEDAERPREVLASSLAIQP
jgi:LssY C-terminus